MKFLALQRSGVTADTNVLHRGLDLWPIHVDYSVDMNNKPGEPFTTEQFLAARMLVARLRSEASFEPFEFEDLGITWMAGDNTICAHTDTGELLRLGDLFYAAVVMLWSLVVAQADEEQAHPLDVISRLGIGLALHDPT